MLTIDELPMEKTDLRPKLEFMVKSTIMDRQRLLVIDPEYLEFDDQDRISEPRTRFLKAEIEGIRYGVKAIRGYRFRIGRTFHIDIRDVGGRIIRIRLKSVYRVRRKLLGEKYQAILGAILRYYFHDIMHGYVRQLRSGQPVDLLGVNLNGEGVLFDPKVGRVSWDFIGTKSFWHYYTLFSEENPGKYRTFVFVDDWNAGVLRGVVEAILKDKLR
jgi:hypothetical protein